MSLAALGFPKLRAFLESCSSSRGWSRRVRYSGWCEAFGGQYSDHHTINRAACAFNHFLRIAKLVDCPSHAPKGMKMAARTGGRRFPPA